MAGTDKDTNRGHASGSADQSPQSPGEVARSTVAPESAGSLKPAPVVQPVGAGRRLSHEAKLGIMVIMVLVFSFGFLVYRKMDLHQQRLTQASIGAQGAADTNANTEGTGSDSGDPLAVAARDEMSSRVSPFADPFGGATEQLTSDSDAANPASANVTDDTREPAFAFTEPSVEESAAATSGSSPTMAAIQAESEAAEPSSLATTAANNAPLLAENSEPLLAVAESDQAAGSQGSLNNTATLEVADPQGLAQVSTFDQLTAAPSIEDVATQPEQTAEPERENSEPEMELFAADAQQELTSAEAAGSIETGNTSADAALNTGSSPATEFPALASSEPEPQINEPGLVTEVPQSAGREDLTPNGAGIADFSLGAQDSQPAGEAAINAAETVDNNGGTGAASADGSESVLIAMAEPKQDGDFFGGFTPEASPATPAEEPSTVFPAEQDVPTNRTTDGNPKKPSSPGFDAVTKPASRERRNMLRNASGSGADGKFSLAAFNYQNGSVAAAEDGGTHDSVVVQQGENYTKISKRVYGTTRYFSALAVFNQNRIPDPSKMRAGMIVLTPEARILEERYPQLFVDLQPRVAEPAMFMLLDDGTPAYRVGERETLSEISKRYLGRSSRWVEIYEMNQSAVKDPNKLKPGTILALPDDATEVNVMQ